MAELNKTAAFGLRASAKPLQFTRLLPCFCRSPIAPSTSLRAGSARSLCLRQPQFGVFRHHHLPARAVLPVEHAEDLADRGIRIAAHAAIVDDNE
jgi:hypothetical protein